MQKQRILIVVLILALGLAIGVTAIYRNALWDPALNQAFQGNGVLKLPMTVFTFLGSEGFFLLLVPLVFWCIDKPLGIDLGVLLMLSGFVNGLLKALLKHPRPFWSAPALKLADATSFSLPSGHAQNTTVLFGYLAWRVASRNPFSGRKRVSGRAWRWLAVALLLLMILFVSLSRVYLGVHFPGDVLWGCAVGVVLLALYIGLKPRVAAWLRGLSLETHVLLAIASALAVLAFNNLALAIPVGDGPLYGTIYVAARSQTLAEAASLAGMVLGLWIGLVLEARYVRFATAGSLWQRALRYVLGLAGLLIIWLGLSLIFPAEPPALGLALRVVRYAAAMLWAIAAWPWLFVRIGLGTRTLQPTIP